MVERYVVTPIYVSSMKEKFSDITEGIYWTLWAMTLYYAKCTIFKFWNSRKLLRALRKSSTRSSDHLNLEFESVPAAATCSLMLLANLFFIEFFSIRICYFVVVCLSIYACASSSIDRAEWLYETSWHGQPSWLAFQKRASTAKCASSLSAHFI